MHGSIVPLRKNTKKASLHSIQEMLNAATPARGNSLQRDGKVKIEARWDQVDSDAEEDGESSGDAKSGPNTPKARHGRTSLDSLPESVRSVASTSTPGVPKQVLLKTPLVVSRAPPILSTNQASPAPSQFATPESSNQENTRKMEGVKPAAKANHSSKNDYSVVHSSMNKLATELTRKRAAEVKENARQQATLVPSQPSHPPATKTAFSNTRVKVEETNLKKRKLGDSEASKDKEATLRNPMQPQKAASLSTKVASAKQLPKPVPSVAKGPTATQRKETATLSSASVQVEETTPKKRKLDDSAASKSKAASLKDPKQRQNSASSSTTVASAKQLPKPVLPVRTGLTMTHRKETAKDPARKETSSSVAPKLSVPNGGSSSYKNANHTSTTHANGEKSLLSLEEENLKLGGRIVTSRTLHKHEMDSTLEKVNKLQLQLKEKDQEIADLHTKHKAELHALDAKYRANSSKLEKFLGMSQRLKEVLPSSMSEWKVMEKKVSDQQDTIQALQVKNNAMFSAMEKTEDKLRQVATKFEEAHTTNKRLEGELETAEKKIQEQQSLLQIFSQRILSKSKAVESGPE